MSSFNLPTKRYKQKYNNLNIEKIAFKVVQMKFLAMHITNQNLVFDMFTVENVLNIFMEHDLNIIMIFWHKRKMDHFEPYNVLLDIAANIAVLLMTAFVAHIYIYIYITYTHWPLY